MKDNLLGIHHIGLASKNPKKTQWFFNEVLGFSSGQKEPIKDQRTIATKISWQEHKGEGAFEILEAMDGQGPIHKYLEKKGGGIHHVAIQVKNLDKMIGFLMAHHVKMIDEKPRHGAGGCLVSFVHPESTGGILVEFVETVP